MADRCTSYDDFKERLFEIRKNHSKLNRLTKPEVADIEVKTTFIRGAVISVMSVWEAYIQDLLEEVFGIVIGYIEREGPAAVLKQATLRKKQAPKEIIRKSIEHYMYLQVDKSNLDNKSKLSLETAACMSMELLNPDLWKELLETYKKSALDKLLHLTPVFYGSDGIDQKFTSLLSIAKDQKLSGVIISQGEVCHTFVCDPGVSKKLQVDSSDALNDVIRLYYGVRCAFAHGKNRRTFEKSGCLFEFPSRENLTSRIGGEKRICERLYSNVQEYGSEAWIQYLHLINLQRFVMILALRLCKAVAQVVSEEFGIPMWKFDCETVHQEQYDLDWLFSLEDQ